MSHTSKLSDSIKSGLATAAKIGTAAITAAATGIAALTKASVQNYAEYEQLVGGVDTLFKNASGKVQEYAANAYQTAGMSANEYMQTVTSFSAALVNSLATTTETATGAVTEATIDNLNKQLDAMQDTQDKNVEAVESANEKEIELLEESYEKQLEDFEKLTEERIKLIDKQYAENMKLVDEEEYRRLQAVQAQIDAINAEQAADDKAAKQREENEKKAALQEKISTAETAEEKKKAQEEYNEYLEELRQEQIEADRKARIDSLKSKKEAIKEEADEKRKALKEQRDNDVKVIQESAAVELQERKKGQAAQLKALKESQAAELKALKDSNKQKLEAMRDYIAQQKKLVTDGTVQVVNATAETYEQAADLANMAITDMSDNANKMGTDMEMLQNAYNGFAKQNYTMLDNLKLGYGGTKEEMQRLLERAEELSGFEYDISSYADIVKAIHVVQDEMGITGTTAAEASKTISGSMGAAKAAWSNLVTGVADDNADFSKLLNNFVNSVSTAAKNLVPRVKTAIIGIGQLISQTLPIIVNEIPAIIKDVVPDLLNAAMDLVGAIGQGFLDNADSLLSSALDLVTKLVDFIIQGLPSVLTATLQIIQTIGNGLVEYAPKLITSVTEVVLKLVDMLTNPDTLVQMIDVALKLVLGIADGFIKAIPELIKAIPTIIDNVVTAIVDSIPLIVDAGTQLLGALIDNTDVILDLLFDGVLAIIDGIIGFFTDEKDNESGYSKMVKAGYKLVGGLFSNVASLYLSVKSSVGEFIQKLIDKFAETDWLQVGKDICEAIWNGILTAWDTLVEGVQALWEKFKKTIAKSSTHESSSGDTHGGGAIAGSHYNGLDYVPYDGYIAELHKGEMVLTANEARDYGKFSGNNVSIVENIYVQGNYDDAAQRKNNARLANTLAR